LVVSVADVVVGWQAAVEVIIQRYTREAGVRNLSRHLAALARAAAVKVAEKEQSDRHAREMQTEVTQVIDHGGGGGLLAEAAEVEMEVEAISVQRKEALPLVIKPEPMVVDETVLEIVLGVHASSFLTCLFAFVNHTVMGIFMYEFYVHVQPPRFDGREAAERVATPGVAVGLVWTEVGGEVLFVESTAMLGKGDLHLTGQLGDVIKESAQIALTWVKSPAIQFFLHLLSNSAFGI
jgi:ATP-dependent Lon protease